MLQLYIQFTSGLNILGGNIRTFLQQCFVSERKVKVLITQSCPTLCGSTGCSPPGSPESMGILQVRILESVTIPFSRGSSQPRDQMWVSCIAGRFFTSESPRLPFYQISGDLCALKPSCWLFGLLKSTSGDISLGSPTCNQSFCVSSLCTG